MSKLNDILAVEKKFYSSLGDGAKAGVYLKDMVLSVVDSRDTTVLSRAIQRAEDNKADTQAVKAIRTVVSQVWPKAKVSRNNVTNRLSIIIKGIDADQDALARLKAATECEKPLSIRGTAFLKTIKGTHDAEEKDFDPKKMAEGWFKRHDHEQLEAYIAALQALRSK